MTAMQTVDLRIDAPAWIKTTRFDVEGTTKGGEAVSQARAMARR